MNKKIITEPESMNWDAIKKMLAGSVDAKTAELIRDVGDSAPVQGVDWEVGRAYRAWLGLIQNPGATSLKGQVDSWLAYAAQVNNNYFSDQVKELQQAFHERYSSPKEATPLQI